MKGPEIEPDALAVACPTCIAAPRTQCWDDGHRVPWVHQDRIAKALSQNTEPVRLSGSVTGDTVPKLEWRACAADEGSTPDYGDPVSSQADAAQNLLDILRDAQPAYAKGWVEYRAVGKWTSLPDIELKSK